MIGGRRPIKGRKPADRRVRVERPHSAFFRYTGPGQMVAKPAASVALTPTGRFIDRTRAHPVRPAAGERGGDRRAPVQTQGAGDLQLGRDQLVGLRHRRDHARPPRGRRVRPASIGRGRDRDHDPPRGRVHLVSPGLPGLPEWWRRLRRGQDEPGADHGSHRRGGPADRLRHDRRRIDRRRDHADPVGRARGLRLPDRDRVRVDLAHHDRKPSRPARVRQHLRGPDLSVRRSGPDDRRDRAGQHHRRHGRAGRLRSPTRSRSRRRPSRNRSASCCCSRHSRVGRWP